MCNDCKNGITRKTRRGSQRAARKVNRGRIDFLSPQGILHTLYPKSTNVTEDNQHG